MSSFFMIDEKDLITLPPLKRIFDILLSSIFLVALSPFVLVVMVAMKIETWLWPDSRGPIFYSETRISQGRPFSLYKFRIFKQSFLEKFRLANGHVHTKILERTRGSMTGVGWILKKIYMDEFPQFWCVLKGDMTIVGPRPTNPQNYERWVRSGKISKALIKAGVTGHYQAHKGRKLPFDQDQLDMQYIEYVRTHSEFKILLFDLKILAKTLVVVFRAEGI